MGSMILELVLEKLRAGGFRAELAYPGQRFPAITGPVAAVHIEKVDKAGQTVTAEVNIVSPAALGGTACETAGLQALEILHGAGAVCTQSGCSYLADGQVYTVSVLAEFVCTGSGDGYALGPGFQVYAGGVLQPHAVGVTAEKTAGHEARYAMGSANPVGISQGSWRWEITLEERIPVGMAETAEPTEPFTLQIVREKKKEVYSGCRWVTVRREFTREGLHRVRKAIAQLRQEA